MVYLSNIRIPQCFFNKNSILFVIALYLTFNLASLPVFFFILHEQLL